MIVPVNIQTPKTNFLVQNFAPTKSQVNKNQLVYRKNLSNDVFEKNTNLNFGGGKLVRFSMQDSLDASLNSPDNQKCVDKFISDLINAGKSIGFKFSTEYNTHPIKSAESVTSKMKRAAEVNDKFRATLFNEEIYDLSKLKKLLDYMTKKCNYKIFDFDIRIDKTKFSPEQLKNLDGYSFENSGAIGAYEDIQIRFSKGRKNEPKKFELIILQGQHTANAKTVESEDVYNITREFGGIKAKTDKITRNVNVITSILRENISKPLFDNAREMDTLGHSTGRQPGLTEQQISLINNLMKEIRSEITLYKQTHSRDYRAGAYNADKNAFENLYEKLNITLDKYKSNETIAKNNLQYA